MKQILKLLAPLLTLLLLLPGCGGKNSITGTWACQVPTSLIGTEVSQQATLVADLTVTFEEDGFGTWEMKFPVETHSQTDSFTYTQEGEQFTLTLDSSGVTYDVVLDGDALTLTNPRITYQLTRTK